MLPATMAVGCVMAHCNAEKQSSWELTRNLYTYVMHIELKLGPTGIHLSFVGLARREARKAPDPVEAILLYLHMLI